MGLFFTLISALGWGLADIFYKKGADELDRLSHLKTAVCVGLTMGIVSIVLLFTSGGMSLSEIPGNALKYAPASLCYILSMVIGYAGLRYLELSVISPVQNASGAFSAIAMLLWFVLKGKGGDFLGSFSALDICGTVIIVAGVIALAVAEKKLEGKTTDKKYKYGAKALIFPLLYCVFDTAGTAADGIILDEDSGTGFDEIQVLILYGLTFLLAGIVAWIYIFWKTKKPYNPFTKKESPKLIASACEEFGQIFYVYAMADNPVIAAPVIASYCVVSVILSAVFLKERLKKPQYASVVLVILGIIMLGISEGLSEI